MATASATTSVLFAVLVLVMVGLTGVVLGRDGVIARSRAARGGVLIALAVVYVIVPAMLAWSGLLNQYSPVPRPMILVGALTAMTLIAAFSPLGARLGSTLALSTLIGFHFFRVPVELLLHRLAAEGAIPHVMTYAGLNFDILTGISAAILGLLLVRRHVSRRVLMTWNVVGLLLLANIATIAVLAAPVPFQLFVDGPSNTMPSSFPYVWMPAVLVQIALFGHVLLFRRLRVPTAV